MRRDHQPFRLLRARLAFMRWYTRHFFAPQLDALGEGATVMRPWSVVVFGAGIRLGRFVHVISERSRRVQLAAWSSPTSAGRIDVGDYALILPGVRISSASAIRIGGGCMIASEAYLSDADWHGIHDRTFEIGATAPIALEDDVWIGDGAFVGKGVTVGQGSIVGARAVVTRDVPPRTIVAGNPARVVRDLGDEPLVGRDALFDASPEEMERRIAYLQYVLLRRNSVAGWLRAALFPRRGD
jgi:acetyltransferase-like isoleucine patch superfamily enzyme